jgi:heme exporter protein B
MKLYAIFVKELRVLQRKQWSWIYPCCLYLLLTTLFPFGLEMDPALLRSIAPGVIWMSAILAVMVSNMSLFQQDFQEGVVEAMVFSALPLSAYALAKILAWWCRAILPLVLVTPALALSYGLAFEQGVLLSEGLILGTLSMSLIVALCNALTLALRENGIILSLLVLPLMIPPLIFGASLLTGEEKIPVFCILLGLLLFNLALCPFGIARALRLSLGR